MRLLLVLPLASSLFIGACSDPGCRPGEIEVGSTCYRKTNDGGLVTTDSSVSGATAAEEGDARAGSRAPERDAGLLQDAFDAGEVGVDAASTGDADAGPDGGGPITCGNGYVQAGQNQCVDENECERGTDDCSSSPEACINDVGGFHCACPAGYSGAGKGAGGCADIDECALKTAKCDPLAECNNTSGSYTCGACTAGYVGGANGTCTDACTVNNGGCSANAVCSHPAGLPIACSCPPGTSGSGVGAGGCADICSVNNGGCHINATCSHQGATVSCKCPAPTLGANLVSDSGFESQGMTIGSPWRSDPNNATTVNYDTVLGHGSPKALRLYVSFGTASVWQRVVVLPNSHYRLTAWGRGTASRAAVGVIISGHDSMDQPNGIDYAQAGPFSGVNWMNSTVEFDTGSFTAFALLVHAASDTTSYLNLEVDDITLQQVVTVDCKE